MSFSKINDLLNQILDELRKNRARSQKINKFKKNTAEVSTMILQLK